MSRIIDIIGIGAEGPARLSELALTRLAAATFLAGGRRHLEWVESSLAERFVITDNLTALVDRLRDRGEEERCVVLATGDPLCFGIGRRLGLDLGRDQIRVEPSVSSMQLAFARAGLAWEDASLASIHGRPQISTLLPLLGRPKIGLFTRDGSSPSEVARFLIERGLNDYTAWVGERLGTIDERVTQVPIADLIGRTFDDLNFVVLERQADAPLFSSRFAAPDDLFSRPTSGPILLTHQDVRAVTLSRFRDLPEGSIWDVGAGLGGVSIDLARAFATLEVVAYERVNTQASYLIENRRRFATYNLRIVGGEAPESLFDEGQPAGVFLGGTGGRLDDILDVVFDRLIEGGVLVANFVGFENLARFLERAKRMDWEVDLTQVQINQGSPLGELTTLVPLRPVWIVSTRKPRAYR